MSVDLCVFLHGSRLPSHEQWQRSIQEAGHDLVFNDFSPIEHVGFLPTRLDGKECGFEYSVDAIEGAEDDAIRSLISDRTHVATFIIHGSKLDLDAAEIAASVLTDITNGVFFDPQSGVHAEGKSVYELLAGERSADRERRHAEAEQKWAKVTDRRCPECNSLCPEYRGSCWVCGSAVGKLPA